MEAQSWGSQKQTIVELMLSVHTFIETGSFVIIVNVKTMIFG